MPLAPSLAAAAFTLSALREAMIDLGARGLGHIGGRETDAGRASDDDDFLARQHAAPPLIFARTKSRRAMADNKSVIFA